MTKIWLMTWKPYKITLCPYGRQTKQKIRVTVQFKVINTLLVYTCDTALTAHCFNNITMIS